MADIQNTFLYSVAKDIHNVFEGDYSDCKIIFTNRRGATFFNEALYSIENKPFFAPQYLTIDDFVKSKSNLVLADQIVLIYYLYEVYCEVFYTHNPANESQEKESFEHFYPWGKMLLADFDDIDKNLAIAEDVFSLIKDYKEIEEHWDFLNEQQKTLLHQIFGKRFEGKFSDLQKNFVSVWNCLQEIYSLYNARLKDKGLAYGGMLYRDVLLSLQQNQEQTNTYCIVGFNVLNKVEKRILLWLKDNAKTRFYWDWDTYYTDDKKQEAGLFMRQNLSVFACPQSFDIDNNLIANNSSQITIIDSPSENEQVSYVSKWLSALPKETQMRDVAIVLCSESLLPSVVAALPQQFNGQDIKVNVTMGYDFSTTALYALIDSYLKYQYSITNPCSIKVSSLMPFLENNYVKEFFSPLTLQIRDSKFLKLESSNKSTKLDYNLLKQSNISLKQSLSNPLLYKQETAQDLIEALHRILFVVAKERANGEEKTNDIDAEPIYRITLALNNISSLLVQNPQITISGKLLYATIRRVLASIRVPFLSDQINGIQIMGLLESRSLDFKHILFLSASDDNLPNVSMDSSFIPYSIRKGYDLSTIERKIAVFGYYFYRLLQRSQTIDFVYNNTTSATRPKELSRFLRQLQIESGKEIKYLSLPSQIDFVPQQEISIIKQQKDIDKIISKGDSSYYSPSYLNDFFNCEQRFYLKDVLGIVKPQQQQEDLQANDFGSIFHDSMCELYSSLQSNSKVYIVVSKENIKSLRSQIESAVTRNYNKIVFPNETKANEDIEYTQMHRIHLQELFFYVRKMLDFDFSYAPFTIIGQELKVQKELLVYGRTIKIGGRIDRIDLKNNVLRIIDYKTNNNEKTSCKQENLFWVDYTLYPKEKRNDYFAQLLIYCWLIRDNNQLNSDLKGIDLSQLQIRPTLIYIRTLKPKENPLCLIAFSSDRKPISEYTQELHSFVQQELTKGIEKLLTMKAQSPCLCNKQSEQCAWCDYALVFDNK